MDDTTYLQFWTFSPNSKFIFILIFLMLIFFSLSEASLKFLLEIPNVSAVLSLIWCPLLTERTLGHLLFKNLDKKKDITNIDDVLGYLAVGTNIGKIFIYR